MRPGGERGTRHGQALGAFQILVRMGIGMALLVFGGYALDRVLGTFPWLLLTGTLIGAALMLYDLLRGARKS